MEFANQYKKCIIISKAKQVFLADRTGYDPSYISRYSNGIIVPPNHSHKKFIHDSVDAFLELYEENQLIDYEMILYKKVNSIDELKHALVTDLTKRYNSDKLLIDIKQSISKVTKIQSYSEFSMAIAPLLKEITSFVFLSVPKELEKEIISVLEFEKKKDRNYLIFNETKKNYIFVKNIVSFNLTIFETKKSVIASVITDNDQIKLLEYYYNL